MVVAPAVVLTLDLKGLNADDDKHGKKIEFWTPDGSHGMPRPVVCS